MKEKMLNPNDDTIKKEAEQNWENLKNPSSSNLENLLGENDEEPNKTTRSIYKNKSGSSSRSFGTTTWKKAYTISISIAFLVLLTGIVVFFAVAPFKSKNDEMPIAEPFKADADYHWKKCDECGEILNKSEHTYDNCLDENCNVCGYKRVAGHKYADNFEVDASTHYIVCTVCGNKKDQQEHSFEYGKCTVCGYVAETLEGLGYTFDRETQSYYVNSMNLPDVKYLKIPEFFDDGENGKHPVTSISLIATSTGDILGLYLSKNISEFSGSGFSDCANCFDNLAEVVVDPENPVYHCSGNCVIETATKTLVFGCKNSIIPDDGSVIEIGMFAFCLRSISSVDIPEGVIAINYFALGFLRSQTQEVLVVLPRSIVGISQHYSLSGAIVCFKVGIGTEFDGFESYKLYWYAGGYENAATYIKNAGARGYAMYSETLPSEEDWEDSYDEGFYYWHYVDGVPTLWDEDDILEENN